jgi:hypothetical protein
VRKHRIVDDKHCGVHGQLLREWATGGEEADPRLDLFFARILLCTPERVFERLTKEIH